MTVEPEKLWPDHLVPYAFELRFQLSAAETAFKSLERRIQERRRIALEIQEVRRTGGPPPLQMERQAFNDLFWKMANMAGPILGDIQAFLAASGVVTSVLWPRPTPFGKESAQIVADRVARGKEICQFVGVVDDSILNTRTGGPDDVRGGFLHFDEMLEQFRRDHPTMKFVAFDIGSRAEGTSIRRADAVRWFDEDTFDLWVNGRSGNLRAIREELVRIGRRVTIKAELTMVHSGRNDKDPPPFGMAFGA
jgi:hypothetical protein